MVDWGAVRSKQQRARHAASSTAVKILAAAKIKEDFGFIYFGIIFAIYFGIKKPIRHWCRHLTGGYIPNGEYGRVAPQLGGRHKYGQIEGQKNRGQHPAGRKSPNGAQSATQSDMGADLGESPGRANEVEAFD